MSGAVSLYTQAAGIDPPLGILVALLLAAPSIAVTVRRLHDDGRAGWWWLVGLVPVVGAIVLVVFAAQPGVVGPNAFGPDPKESA